MFSAALLAISVAALAQFAVFYWRAIVTSIAAQPVPAEVFAAAQVDTEAVTGANYGSLAQLHRLTPNLSRQSHGLGLVPAYFKLTQAIGALAAGRFASLASWAETERALCARYAAVQVGRRLEANLAFAASMRSC